MSRFFENLKKEKINEEILEEKKEEKLVQEELVDLSKNEKKQKDLEKKAESLIAMTNQKQFEKAFRKFMQDLTKIYKKIETTPKIVEKLFKDPKISKQSKLLISNFYENISVKNEESEEFTISANKNTNKSRFTLEDVLLLQCNNQKIKEIERLHKENKYVEETYKPLFYAYSKQNKDKEMIELMAKNKTLIKENNTAEIANMLSKIYVVLQPENHQAYEELLIEYNNETLLLHFNYFKLNKIEESNNKIFLPLYYAINNRIEESIEILDLDQNKDSFVVNDVFGTLGKIYLYEGFYEQSWSCFNIVKMNQEVQFYCYLLSIMLYEKREKIKNFQPVFNNFLEEFKSFDHNIFLLESQDKKQELFRAFYYLNTGGSEIFNRIIYKLVPNIKPLKFDATLYN